MPTPVTFPSDLFPGAPTVGLALPDGWQPVVVPGAVLAACRRPDGGPGPVPTVQVRVEWPGPDTGTLVPDAVERLRSEAVGRPYGVASEPFLAPLGGLDLVGVELSWVQEPVGTVLEVHLLHVLPAPVPGGPAQLVRVVGSCGGERVREEYDVLREVLSTVRVTAGTAAGSPVEAPAGVGS